MKELYRLKSASIPIKIAVLSFIGGTLLFITSFLLTIKTDFIFLGFFYVLTSILVNFGLLAFLLYRLIMHSKLRQKAFSELLFVVANIPVALLYMYILYNYNNFFN
ncbi:hypothetical protein FLAN108750_11465 [Flavobacterium antarcticum]|uniref:hypothetical protein n=1 Tax=Flavobacterium antarcticum TaxID=271155 RepID=UPI0003B5A32D|nr:hypothetical protein [Flavobacterium antarcticum]